MASLIYKKLKEVSGKSIEVYGSPQYTAARWILSSDPSPEGTRSADDPRLLQRYTLAAFYFATNNQGTWAQCYQGHDDGCKLDGKPFLSEADECEWSGITCDQSTRMVTAIDLSNNKLKGHLINELGTLTSLNFLDVSLNEMSGSIPESLANTELVELIVSANKLVGPFPSSLYGMKSLEHICIDRNKFVEMPDWASMPNLKYIYAFENKIEGQLDPAIGQKLENLEVIDVHDNKISGGIPPKWKNLKNLLKLKVNNNRLSGEVSDEIFGLPRLTELWLASNDFIGEIPSTIGELGSAWSSTGVVRGKYIRLESNNFTGNIPREIANIKDLYFISLEENNFSGEMPEEVCAIPTITSSINGYGLFKITSTCSKVDCSCLDVCQCIEE